MRGSLIAFWSFKQIRTNQSLVTRQMLLMQARNCGGKPGNSLNEIFKNMRTTTSYNRCAFLKTSAGCVLYWSKTRSSVNETLKPFSPAFFILEWRSVCWIARSCLCLNLKTKTNDFCQDSTKNSSVLLLAQDHFTNIIYYWTNDSGYLSLLNITV